MEDKQQSEAFNFKQFEDAAVEQLRSGKPFAVGFGLGGTPIRAN